MVCENIGISVAVRMMNDSFLTSAPDIKHFTDHLKILQALQPHFPIFLCQSYMWRKHFLKLVQYSWRVQLTAANKQAPM